MRVDTEVRALPARIGLPLGVTSVVAAVVLVFLGFWFSGESVGASVDVGLRDYLRQLEPPWQQIALVIDWTGEPVGAAVVLATIVIVMLRRGDRRAALLAVAGPAAAVAVTTGMKPLVGRTINDGFLSFPSGHTATATAFALVVMLVVVRERSAVTGMLLIGGVTVVAGAAMAWAQVLLNAHYPTDTLGGFCATFAVVPAVAWGIDRMMGDRVTAPAGDRGEA